MTRVLITGGAGYIGSHTCHYLIANGIKPEDIIVIDDLSNGHKEALPDGIVFYQNNLLGIWGARNFGLTLRKTKPDIIIHFAGKISVNESIKQPELYHEANAKCLSNILLSMYMYGVKNIVFSSSCAVYGSPEDIPITEDTPTNPITPYGQSKLDAEKLLEHANKLYGINYISLRYFNAAGAMPDGSNGEWHKDEFHLIPLIFKSTAEKPLKIFGTDYDTPDGTCIRDYIHVLDLADAHMKASSKLLSITESFHEIYNVGTGNGTSIKELKRLIELEIGKDIPSVDEPKRDGDPPVLIANADKIKNDLEWIPKYNINDIIKHAWLWHKVQ